MKIDIITAFPDAFSYLEQSIVKRAKDKGAIELNIIDLRDFAEDKRKTIDDKPFGGGAGMLLQVEPLYKVLKSLNVFPKTEDRKLKTRVVLTSPSGKDWSQNIAHEFADELEHLIIICGHYEGVDQRVIDNMVDLEISIGNFILSGGELASMVMVDTIARLLPGVLGNDESIMDETSFTGNTKLPEYPQYTRPEVFKTDEGEEWDVPKVLLSGNHKEIKEWKEEKRIKN